MDEKKAKKAKLVKEKAARITRKRYITRRQTRATKNALTEPIASKALETFQNEEKARRWLEKPNRSLDNKRPIDISRTSEGAKRVEALLDRIKYGIYS